MNKKFNVAVVGATGVVGETMLSILAERDFPVGKVHAVASSRSAGEKIEFKGENLVFRQVHQYQPSMPR